MNKTMNNYRVQISRKDGFAVSANSPVARLLRANHKGVSTETEARKLNFVTKREDLAMSIYAKAKRNLDAKHYSVSLELPERKPLHLGSC